ncbi:hypothetical protein KGF43_15520 [Clostridioides sp. ZZV14-6044]|uniref:hypothetical protein n=1 Tax=Clostridioides sp. ZZV14-6044 TaxID=2811488 RepID=UPI001D121478|nr:hypothetical protein [Clostridioides sp. ZZV14-6044]
MIYEEKDYVYVSGVLKVLSKEFMDTDRYRSLSALEKEVHIFQDFCLSAIYSKSMEESTYFKVEGFLLLEILYGIAIVNCGLIELSKEQNISICEEYYENIVVDNILEILEKNQIKRIDLMNMFREKEISFYFYELLRIYFDITIKDSVRLLIANELKCNLYKIFKNK